MLVSVLSIPNDDFFVVVFVFVFVLVLVFAFIFYLSFFVFVFVFEISTTRFISPITVNTLLPKLFAVGPGDVCFGRFERMTSLSLWFECFAPQMRTSLSLSLLFECLASCQRKPWTGVDNLGLGKEEQDQGRSPP